MGFMIYLATGRRSRHRHLPSENPSPELDAAGQCWSLQKVCPLLFVPSLAFSLPPHALNHGPSPTKHTNFCVHSYTPGTKQIHSDTNTVKCWHTCGRIRAHTHSHNRSGRDYENQPTVKRRCEARVWTGKSHSLTSGLVKPWVRWEWLRWPRFLFFYVRPISVLWPNKNFQSYKT